MRPTLPLLLAPAIAALIAVTAWASAPTPGGRPMDTTPEDPGHLQPVKQWPLRFKEHSFSAYTYDTRGAKVVYAGHLQVNDDPDVLIEATRAQEVHQSREHEAAARAAPALTR